MSIGIDGCKAGWFYFRVEGSSMTFGGTATLAEILTGIDEDACILVDMPIGLLESGKTERQCDLAARSALSPHRASSIFPAPCREALEASSCEAACETNERRLGRTLSKQPWALVQKIRELIEFAAEEIIAAAFLVHGGFDAGRDDVVDAFVAAICARAAENLQTLPEQPALDKRGLAMEICYLPGISAVRPV